MGFGTGEPLLGRVQLHRAAPLAGLGLAALDAVVLPLMAAVPDILPFVERVRHQPMNDGARPVPSAGRSDAAAIEALRQCPEPHIGLQVGPEQPANHFDAGRVAEDETIVLHRQAVGRDAAVPPALLGLSRHPAGHVAAQVAEVGMLALLLDCVNDTARETVPIYLAICDRFQPDADVPQGLDPEAGLQAIEAPEAILVPAEDDLEVSQFLGVPDHLQEAGAAGCVVAADALVLVFAHDLVAVPLGECLDGLALRRDALLLPVGRHPVVGCRPRETLLRHASPPFRSLVFRAKRS
jgi:hypothetical protein